MERKEEIISKFRFFLRQLHLEPDTIIILLLFVVICSYLSLPIERSTFEVKIGEVWNRENLYAPFDFMLLKKEQEYEKEKRELLSQIPEVFYLDKTNVEEALFVHDSVLNKLLPDSVKYIVSESRQVLLRLYNRPILNKSYPEILSEVISVRSDAISEIILHKNKALDVNIATEEYLRELGKVLKDSTLLAKIREETESFIIPNYIYDSYTTELARKQVNYLLSRYEKIIKSGTLIIANGERITEEHLRVINSLNQELKRRGIKLTGIFYIGHWIIIFVIIVISYYYFRITYTRLFYTKEGLDYKGLKFIVLRNRKFILVFTFIVLILFISYVLGIIARYISVEVEFNIYWATPVIIAPVLATIFFNERVGFYINIIVALLVSIKSYYDYNIFFVFAVGGSAVSLIMRRLRHRRQLGRTIIYLLGIYFISYLGTEFVKGTHLMEINKVNLFLLMVNGVLTLLFYPLVYLFERIFGVPSVLAYLDYYQDLSHPLLSELSRKAPGTYQHSLQVANISELCAQKLGYNAILVKSGALFHDIGKMDDPKYFIENQNDEKELEDIDPKTHAQIIIRHVEYGVEKAKEFNLPEEIIDFIRTHHGTSIVRSLYEKYRAINPDADDKDFRYKGPKPQTKEQALLMIVDSIEAASRSKKDPSPEELNKLVDNIINQKLKEEQLDESSMTFYELNMLRKYLKEILHNIFHKRIEYPEEKENVKV